MPDVREGLPDSLQVNRIWPMSRAKIDDELRRVTEQVLRAFSPAAEQAPQLLSPRAGLYLLRQPKPSAFDAAIYDPMLCLVLRGCKEMNFAGETYRLGAGECAVISHDLPIRSRVRTAPYLVALVRIEVDLLRSLYEEVGDLESDGSGAHAIEVHSADAHLLDVVGRYVAVAESDRDARVLGAPLLRELHYRLVVSSLGDMLRHLLRYDSHASAVARAVAILRKDFRSKIVVEELARAVGMSVSSFHKHFKAVMASSPLQYQKGLRLLEARRMLAAGAASVTTVALDVGYESPSQFSREYARKFGRPPSYDASKAQADAG